MSNEHEPQAIRAEALEAILIEKGLLTPAQVDDVIVQYNERVGPMRGAQVVARAWTDEEFKGRLLADATSAIAEYEFDGGETDKLVVVEKKEEGKKDVVCKI